MKQFKGVIDMREIYFEEQRAEEERRRLSDVDRNGWMLTAAEAEAKAKPVKEWRLCASFRSLSVCLTLRRESHVR